MKCSNCGAKLSKNARFCSVCGAQVGTKMPHKKKKTALIIVIIALVLAVAVISGTVFIMTRVNAKEIQEAKDNYEPPAKTVQIDTSLQDPSNDEISFKFDDRARIVSCTYSTDEKEYVQTYYYHDDDRMIEIAVTYKDHPIHTKEIEYNRVESVDTFEDVDGYYVRLDEESMGTVATEIPTDIQTEEPTEEPTEPFDDTEEYHADMVQMYNGRVYYCSAEGVSAASDLPVVDFSAVKPDYIKLAAADGQTIVSFIIYDGKLYYLTNYDVRDFAQSIERFADVYVSDLDGSNAKLLVADVHGDGILITNRQLHYRKFNSVDQEKGTTEYLDLTTGETGSSDKEIPKTRETFLYRYLDSDNEYAEFDGGYYYVYIEKDLEKRNFNGHYANKFYYRKDIETGEEVVIGYSVNQAY